MNPDLNVVVVPVVDLVPDPENARKHSQKNLDAIAGSLRLFGQRRPLVVHGQVVIAGNGTLEAAKSLGWSHVAITRTPGDWSVEQARAYALADNRTAELAAWDDRILADQLVELDAVGWDLSEIGFEPLHPPTDSDVQDVIPEVPQEPITALGDLWQIGPHRILCGDSSDRATLDRVFRDATVGCVLTDPPYGINVNTDWTDVGGSTKALLKGTKGGKYRPVANDDKPFDASLLCAYFEGVREQFWFGADYYRRTIPADDLAGSWLVWDKRNESADAGFGSGFKLIWSRERHKRDLIRFYHFGAFGAEGRGRVHPHKSLWECCFRSLKDWAPPECVVADPLWFGSNHRRRCSTGRVGRGIELEPGYVDVIVQRLEQETGLKADRLAPANG